ncbi:DNA polymerase IV [Nonomuraea cavernae]|uniref:DNA polymerase IV n=1 Tax=Nonomuraea cavernae TaxID=2045107 RepID=A0A917ZDE2_9ACTN|nr:DNA polymerase IV [Nonomuraea cavernae]MCA2188751.1 DNA polymerase IV [Nonomuraea cavernae]GGO80935.1 DNA polymerase IV [Nonomuraea cavernae]
MSTRDWILHVDLDQFIAAVELLRRPELRGRPVVVGGSGDPTRPRTVAATATYEARAHGVRSGMPLRTALRLCPDAVFLPTDPPAYEAASERVMATLRAFPAEVEVWGWDEAFVGARTDDPEALAAAIRRAVLAETGLSCSVGIGDNKHQAKLASGLAKPAGVFRLTGENWAEVMYRRPTDALWGIGAKISRRLAGLGLRTVAELAAADPAELARHFGPTNGPWYHWLALGKGEAEIVTTPWVPRGHSRETTFAADLTDGTEIAAHVAALAGRVAADAAAGNRVIVRVAVKVRFAPFLTRTRQSTLPVPTTDAAELTRAALAVLGRFDLDRPVRLLGVAVDYAMPDQSRTALP